MGDQIGSATVADVASRHDLNFVRVGKLKQSCGHSVSPQKLLVQHEGYVRLVSLIRLQ